MKNIIPKSEGIVDEEVMLEIKKELLDVLKPILDGWDGMADAQVMIMEAIQGATVVKALDSSVRTKAVLAALFSIGSDAGMDLLLIYPEEEQSA